ncbi:hypothetical protein FKM82_013155 [Ascaphus truei]
MYPSSPPYPHAPAPTPGYYPAPVVTTQPMPMMYVPQPTYRDYLGLSIMNMLLCCLPIGIAATIFSCKTRDSVSRQDMASAESNSRTAFTLNMVALGIGLAINVAWIAYVIYAIVAFQPYYYG